MLQSFDVGLDDSIRWFVNFKRPYSIIDALKYAIMGTKFLNVMEMKRILDSMLTNQENVGDSS